jgi:hypothetical protein
MIVILSDVPVRLGPKDLSYLGDVFRIVVAVVVSTTEPNRQAVDTTASTTSLGMT